MSRCHSCGATIGWVLGRNKAIPVEEAYIDAWVVDVPPPSPLISTKLGLVQDDGSITEAWVCSPTTEGARQIHGRESHAAHCDDTKQRRSPR